MMQRRRLLEEFLTVVVSWDPTLSNAEVRSFLGAPSSSSAQESGFAKHGFAGCAEEDEESSTVLIPEDEDGALGDYHSDSDSGTDNEDEDDTFHMLRHSQVLERLNDLRATNASLEAENATISHELAFEQALALKQGL